MNDPQHPQIVCSINELFLLLKIYISVSNFFQPLDIVTVFPGKSKSFRIIRFMLSEFFKMIKEIYHILLMIKSIQRKKNN